MILTLYFAYAREVIQNSIKLRDFVQAFGPQISIFYYLMLVRSIYNEKLEILFFSGKIVTSLAYIFFRCKRMIRSHFAGGVSEQGGMQ